MAGFFLVLSVQALYVPHTVREGYKEPQSVSSHGLGITNNVLSRSAKDPYIGTSSVSLLLVGREAGETPPPGPYKCETKADCQARIVYATHQIKNSRVAVHRAERLLKAAGSDKTKKRAAKNELHTSTESLDGWKEERDFYRNCRKMLANKRQEEEWDEYRMLVLEVLIFFCRELVRNGTDCRRSQVTGFAELLRR